VIPPKSNLKVLRPCDKTLYTARNLVERLFLKKFNYKCPWRIFSWPLINEDSMFAFVSESGRGNNSFLMEIGFPRGDQDSATDIQILQAIADCHEAKDDIDGGIEALQDATRVYYNLPEVHESCRNRPTGWANAAANARS